MSKIIRNPPDHDWIHGELKKLGKQGYQVVYDRGAGAAWIETPTGRIATGGIAQLMVDAPDEEKPPTVEIIYRDPDMADKAEVRTLRRDLDDDELEALRVRLGADEVRRV